MIKIIKIFLNTAFLASFLLIAKAGTDYSMMTKQELGEALVGAAKYENFKAVVDLVQAGADVNFRRSKYGDSALHWAAFNQYFKMGKFLVEKGADVNAQTKDKDTPLILLLKGIEKTKLQFNAIYDKNSRTFNVLDNGISEEIVIKIPLDSAKKIFSKNLDTLLACNDSSRCKLLIQKADGKEYLFVNLEHQNPEQRILAMYSNLDLQKSGLEFWIHIVEFMELLLKKGAKVNIQNKSGDTALGFAVTYDGTEKCKILLKNGARKDIADENGLYPVDFVHGNNEELQDILMPDGIASIFYLVKLLFR